MNIVDTRTGRRDITRGPAPQRTTSAKHVRLMETVITPAGVKGKVFDHEWIGEHVHILVGNDTGFTVAIVPDHELITVLS